MNLELGRASPLDELKNRSGYFTSVPPAGEVDHFNGSFQYQDDSQSIFQGTNQSILSFDTIQTTERLLDRLDLSAEDEMFLQQALKEEEEKNKDHTSKQSQGPILCMPASKFPSLRTQYLSASKDHDSKLNKFSLECLNLRGNVLSSKVEQHYPAKSRYSYLVEEDIDLDIINSKPDMPGELHFNYGKKRHPYRVATQSEDGVVRNGISENHQHQQADVKVVDFEKYRMENSKIVQYCEQLLEINAGQAKSQELSQTSKVSKQHYDYPCVKTPMKNVTIYQDGSNNSTATSFADAGLLSKPKTESSMESDVSSKVSVNNKDGPRVYYSTPTKSCSSPGVETPFGKELSREPVPPYKAHKKKSSFSLKNLFRSPKTMTASEARGGLEDNKSTHNQSSVESSPRKSGNHLRKFIFPANPVIHFERRTPTRPSHKNLNDSKHFRSLSDFNKSPAIGNSPSKYKSKYRNDRDNEFERRLSLDGSRLTKPVPQFQASVHSKQQSESQLNFERREASSSEVAAGSAANLSLISSHIETAIHMRNKGKLKEFATNLQQACLAKDSTAYLLYGLALRDGCGVQKDYKKSFEYIKAATGLNSENHEILNTSVNPFELERHNQIPDVVPEPLAPALYECGIAYLKGLGFEEPDEIKGLKYLEKAASLGHIDSICLCGTIWSKKSTVRKRDIGRAATWFRLAEGRGAHLIGSGWIHKEKYRKPSSYCLA